jgi:hypothetical protein
VLTRPSGVRSVIDRSAIDATEDARRNGVRVTDAPGARQWTEAIPAAIFSAGIAFFCVWTLGTNVVALASLPFDALYVVLVLALCAAVLALRGSSAVEHLFSPGRLSLPRVSLELGGVASLERRTVLAGAGLFLLFAVAAGAQYKTNQFLPLWFLCLLTAVLAIFRTGVAGCVVRLTACPPHGGGVPVGIGTLLVIGGMLAFYYLTSIPDSDDSLFLNFAVGAIRNRGAVFGYDTMLGLPGLAFIKSTYRLESYQLLTAIVSDLTHLPVIVTAHAVVPAFALVFAASVLVLIHRTLFAEDWFVGVAAHLLWLVILDGAMQSYGYHSVPRFFQGKAPFVTAMVPLIAILTILAVRERSWLAVGLIAAAVAASVGFTANAVFAAPLAAALVALPMFLLGDRPRRIACLRLALTILYPAALVAYLLFFDPPRPSEVAGAGTVGSMLWSVLSSPAALAGVLTLLFLAAGAAFFNLTLRGVSLYVLVLLALVLDPFLLNLYGHHVTGNLNYRLLWGVPLPLMLAAITGTLWRSLSRMHRLGVAAAFLAATASPGSVLRRIEWGPSMLKVPELQYRIARTINALTPEGGLILAPEEIAAWIPTLDDARPVVEARAIYLPQRAADMPSRQHMLRKALFEWVSTQEGSRAPAASSALEALDVRVVVIRSDADSAPIRQEMGTIAAYEMVDRVGRYLVYARRRMATR